MLQRIRSYIQAILERDPAARSVWDVVFSYPGFHALVLHRIAHARTAGSFQDAIESRAARA